MRETVAEYLGRHPVAHCFETPALHEFDGALARFGVRSCYMAEYFLPDPRRLRTRDCGYDCRTLYAADFRGLYLPAWKNAVCKARAEYDVLCVGAYDGDTLIGLAGASADCETMWQIGIDVLPQYRRKGIASALTSRLAAEILNAGKVPFYCAAWSNLGSVRNALSCGFFPAWTELTCFGTEKP